MEPSTGRTLDTTELSLEIVEAIRRLNGATMDELAAEFDRAKSTIHGHVSTLTKHHYLVEEGGVYYLSLKFFNLGEYARTRRDIYDLIRDKVVSLARETNEEVDFSVEEYGRTIVLFDTIGELNKQGFQIGQYFYMNTNAAGKAILAEFPAERVERILDYWGLPAETDETITDRQELYAEIEATRERGYAENHEENFAGIRAVGSTVHAPDGSILGALAISGPEYRLPPNEELAESLLTTVEELERDIESSGWS